MLFTGAFNHGTADNHASAQNMSEAARAAAPEKLEYIVLGTNAFAEEAADLVEWKTKKGVPAQFQAIEDIYSEYSTSGGDNLFKLREFLKDQKKVHSELKWVLLLGDSDTIPLRKIYAGAEIYNMLQFYETDHYLSSLNGSWDSDNNGIYGEDEADEDWESDLFLGRLPVGTVSEAKAAIAKILAYERTPPGGNWYTRALIMGSLMDAPNIPDRMDTPSVDEGYNEYKDNAFEVKKKSLDFFPARYNITELYDYDRLPGGEYSLETDTLTRDNAVAEFNSGYALINFAGQAKFNGDSLMQYEYEGGEGTYEIHRFIAWRDLYRYEDAKAAKNGGMLPFMMMPTCDAANFTEDDDSNLEVLLSAGSGGAIGLISSTGVSHRGESIDGNSYGNWWEDEKFWKLFFVDGYFRPGEALAQLKNAVASEILAQSDTNPRIYPEAIKGNLLGLTLLGDPEIPLWTDVPKVMRAELTNLTTGTVRIDISVSDNISGRAVPGALVALITDDKYMYGTTDEDGRIYFNATISNTGSASLTVTAHNYLPVERTEKINLAEPKIGRINDVTMNEDSKIDDYIKLTEIIKDADTPFEDLDIELDASDDEIGVRLDGQNAVDIVPEENWFGISVVTVSASDGNVKSTAEFTVTVLSVNDPPRLTGVPEALSAWEDSLLVYKNISAYDPDSATVEFYDNSDFFEINSQTGSFSFLPAGNDVGIHEICISVTDGIDYTTACFTLTVFEVPDGPEIAEIGDLSATSGEKFSYQVIASDDDGDNLTYSVSPSWIRIDSRTGRLYFTPDDSRAGKHEVTVYVTDGTHTTTETFELTVSTRVNYKSVALVLIFIALGLVIILTFLLERNKKQKKAMELTRNKTGKKVKRSVK